MKLRHALGTRPVTIVAVVTALHSIFYGLGYLTGAGGFSSTVLYPYVQDIMHPIAFGVVLLINAVFVLYGYLRKNDRVVDISSHVQATIWLFVTLVYFIHGAILLGLGIGFVWSFLSAYCAYMFRARLRIQRHAARHAILDVEV